MIDTTPTAANTGSTPTAADIERTSSGLRADLLAIAGKFHRADKQAWRARVLGEQGKLAEAEDARMDANGEYYAASWDLADLLLLLLRHALMHRRDILRQYLADALAPELTELAEAIVRAERGRA